MSDELKMPQMGYDMKEGTIVRWLFETGSHVDKNEVVALSLFHIYETKRPERISYAV